MRAGIENWLLQHWYGTSRPPWYLRLLEPVYNAAFQRSQNIGKSGPGVYRSALPLIVVGNITAGGTGKTPLVIRLCQLALEAGLKPGVASTGYGRQGRETLEVTADSDASRCGDEPVLLAIRTGVPVVVAAERLDAVKSLNEMPLDLVISDDGLQSASLERDIEFCVIDGDRGTGNGHLLPAGPLRELPQRLELVDYVVSNGEWDGSPNKLDVTVMHLRASGVNSLDGELSYPVDQFREKFSGKTLHAFAAIGNPERFFKTLGSLEINVRQRSYPDHHGFKAEDFDTVMPGEAIIMTEKDAVKCVALGLENAWYLPVEARLPEEFELAFKARLAKLKKDDR